MMCPGYMVGKEVCDVLKISSENVRDITIRISSKELVTVYITRIVTKDELDSIVGIVTKAEKRVIEV